MTNLPRGIRAILLDWAGTTVDHGSLAPTRVFLEIFRQRGIPITDAEARGPMGMSKRQHIATIARMPRVASVWKSIYGREPTQEDTNTMYESFLPMQREALAHGADPIPGVVHAIDECRQRGLKIGSTTGYTQALMEVVLPIAARAGYQPDTCICSDEVADGRPAPWMNFRAAESLKVYPMNTILVVDDTPVGIAAGRNSGAWTVAVSRTGNALGLSAAEVDALPNGELRTRLAKIEGEFINSGADFVIPSLADLPDLLDRFSI